MPYRARRMIRKMKLKAASSATQRYTSDIYLFAERAREERGRSYRLRAGGCNPGNCNPMHIPTGIKTLHGKTRKRKRLRNKRKVHARAEDSSIPLSPCFLAGTVPRHTVAVSLDRDPIQPCRSSILLPPREIAPLQGAENHPPPRKCEYSRAPRLALGASPIRHRVTIKSRVSSV